eukprot:7766507-Alexandrium_andersonii.AAC.1
MVGGWSFKPGRLAINPASEALRCTATRNTRQASPPPKAIAARARKAHRWMEHIGTTRHSPASRAGLDNAQLFQGDAGLQLN